MDRLAATPDDFGKGLENLVFLAIFGLGAGPGTGNGKQGGPATHAR